MLTITPIPAFTDNYIWVLHDTTSAWVVDPGTAEGVLSYLTTHQLILSGILLTHHHADHIGGVNALLNAYMSLSSNVLPIIIGPATSRIPMVNYPVKNNDQIELHPFALTLEVIAVPGHTLEHIAFFAAHHAPPLLFCGDTLFAAGCGRIFEGSAAQLYHSLQQLAQLPLETKIYCAHEYTENNLRFALTVESTNQALQSRMQFVKHQRHHNQPTLPSTLAEELATNPFLRTDKSDVIRATKQHHPTIASDPVSIFSALRTWKNNF